MIEFLKIFFALFIAFLIIVPSIFLIGSFGSFCYKYIVYRRIKELYGIEYSWEKSDLGEVAVYNNYIHVPFERLLKFYNVSPDKYEIKESRNFDGVYYLTRTTSKHISEPLYPLRKDIYYSIMDTFSDFLTYQKFCKNIEKQHEQEEQRKKEQQDLQQSDFALGEYVKLVRADIAENERQLNEKIEQLKDELEKQKDMIGE